MEKAKVAVLKGGSSAEREVSLMTAEKIMASIDTSKYDAYEIEAEADGGCGWVEELINSRPDFVLIALHGGIGEDGSVQGLLECLGVPYGGSGVLASAVGMDKYISKTIMKANSIPVADDIFLPKDADYRIKLDAMAGMGFPLVVKPNKGGSGIGIAYADNIEELARAIEEAAAHGGDVLVEKFIDGREVTCGVAERNGRLEVMPILDIDMKEGRYDYKARYEDDRSDIGFSSLPDFMQVMIREIAKKTYRALNCSGYARVDMIVSQEQIYVLEINTLPGLTVRSLIPRALEGESGGVTAFIDCIILEGMRRWNK